MSGELWRTTQLNRKLNQNHSESSQVSESSSTPPGRLSGGGAATAAGILFEQQVGAWIGAWMLADEAIDPRLGLEQAKVEWLRFETEAPIDDILVKTSKGGFVAIQVKTTVDISAAPSKPFFGVVQQLVRHWLACQSGDGSLEWNRPLDAAKDRFVLLVGPRASESIRVDLPAAIANLLAPGMTPRTGRQERALSTFQSCLETAWSSHTTQPFDASVLRKISQLLVVMTFDPLLERPAPRLRTLVPDAADASALEVFLTHETALMMSERGGADRRSLSRQLISRGARLLAAPEFRSDVERLRAQSKDVATILSSYETLDVGSGAGVAIPRECQQAVYEAIDKQSLLITGEPGAGKSGVLSGLSRQLIDEGHDVVLLAVDRHSVETIEGLSRELQLEHLIQDVLAAWDGDGPAWLVIDALDAARGGKSEEVFRSLIEKVIRSNTRWRVVATIRSFDLRMGVRFKELFRGTPPQRALSDPQFSDVRHIRIPTWSDAEFEALLVAIPALGDRLRRAPPRLRDLAGVPFNTRLLCDLIRAGEDGDFDTLKSQVDLLKLYWRRRVEVHGIPGESCLHVIVSSMVESRSLRIRLMAVADRDPHTLDSLVRDGVLVLSDDRRTVQFRHHLLFDYAASRVYISLEDIAAGAIAKESGAGIVLGQGVTFVIQELWSEQSDHADCWRQVSALLAAPECDPIIRGVTSRAIAQLLTDPEDGRCLAAMIEGGGTAAAEALRHIVGALTVRLEDEAAIPIAGWARLCALLSPSVAQVEWSLRVLCLQLVDRSVGTNYLAEIGVASRALLRYVFGDPQPAPPSTAAIGLVAKTYETDPGDSRELLSAVFRADRFAAFGYEEAPEIARNIEHIGRLDPDFTSDIYRHVYSNQVSDDRPTHLGHSKILPLRSNARQDYAMAKYSLGEYFKEFLKLWPLKAAGALLGAMNAYVERSHPTRAEIREVEVDGKRYLLQDDYSHAWAYDPDTPHAEDAEVLLQTFFGELERLPEDQAEALAVYISENATYAVYWARLFMVGARRVGRFARALLPIASNYIFLTSIDTRKDAIDLVAAMYGSLSVIDRENFERRVSEFDFPGYTDPSRARDWFLSLLFRTIGSEKLATQGARARLPAEPEKNPNERFSIRVNSREMQPFEWIDDLDENDPESRTLMGAIEALKAAVGLRGAPESAIGAAEATAHILTLHDVISRHQGANPQLIKAAEGAIGEAVGKVLEAKTLQGLPSNEPDPAVVLAELVTELASSKWPEVSEDTEASFEESVSWGSPAPRVEAAEAVFDLVFQRPALYATLSKVADRLLVDPHPAVRLQVALRLVRIWDIDRPGFWRRVEAFLGRESNNGVLSHFVNGVLNRVAYHAADDVERLALGLLKKDHKASAKAEERLHDQVASILAVLWVIQNRAASGAQLNHWIDEFPDNFSEVQHTLYTLRGALSVGLDEPFKGDAAAVRSRAREVFARAIEQANLRLDPFIKKDPTANEAEANQAAQLLDLACREIYFASGASRTTKEKKDIASLEIFYREVKPLLVEIARSGAPSTIYYLLELLEQTVPIDPDGVFDLIVFALQNGGKTHGFQFESLASDLLVRMVGNLLADYRGIFEDEARRTALVECLDLFIQAGWPAARRLLYRLPDLIQ